MCEVKNAMKNHGYNRDATAFLVHWSGIVKEWEENDTRYEINKQVILIIYLVLFMYAILILRYSYRSTLM